MVNVAQFIRTHSFPIKIIFVGSIVEENSFDSMSDVDVVVLFSTPEEADQGRRLLYRAPRPKEIDYALEMICVDQMTFNRKSEIGGIFYLAQHSGRIF